MTIPERTKLGAYEIVAPLGEGGMGQVYRARDTTLGREVAIKVLPEEFAQDPSRLSRFEREARLLASLSHPNIAAIHGIERDQDAVYLVLELAEGQTLRERMRSGRMSVVEALEIFHQIALGLEGAHEKGIIHRDLKPENVVVTQERVIKILDFGLAKDFTPMGTGDGDAAERDTVTFHSTVPGLILGTVPYMSPEQARGQKLDKRTDIWSFGCCLYEALAGKHPFAADSVSDILAAILQREPDWDALPPDTPPIVIALLKRCFQKDARDRQRDIADVRIEIGEAISVQSGPTRPMYSTEKTSRRPAWFLAALGGFVAGGLSVFFWLATPPESSPVLRFDLELPASAPLAIGSGPSLAVAPDGSRLVYAASRGETTQLFERRFDRLAAVAIPGTEGGASPFFSPDGEWLGFVSEGELRKLADSGGSPVTLAETPAPRGAFWGRDERIVFAAMAAGGLSSMDASGAAVEVLTELAAQREEKSHRWPSSLPGGEALLLTVWSGARFDIEALSLNSGERKMLVENGTHPRYAPTGHLVFARDGALFAAPFDEDRLELLGPEVRVVDRVGVDELSGAAFFGFDENGLLVYSPEGPAAVESEGLASLLSVDRGGVATRLTVADRAFQLPRLSPDERQLVVTIADEDKTDLWIRDLNRATMTRLSFEGNNAAGVWTPDQERIAFSSDRDGTFNLFWKSSDGSGEAVRLTTSDYPQMPTSWSQDGRTLAYTEFDPSTGFDIWLLHVAERRREPLMNTPFDEIGGVFSPDGSLIAYVSDESGQGEIYVRSYPDGGKWQISDGGGTEPVWSTQGRELFYRNREWIVSTSIETEPSFVASKSQLLFETPYAEGETAYPNFDVTSDGRFIMIQGGLESVTTRLNVVVSWFQELERLVPTQ